MAKIIKYKWEGRDNPRIPIREHHASGHLCGCPMKFSDDPTAYVEAHPNKMFIGGES